MIDPATNTVATTIATGFNEPRGVAVSPTTDDVFVANFGDGTVSVIDPANAVIATITVGSRPEAVAVSPTTGDVYVTNFGPGTVSALS